MIKVYLKVAGVGSSLEDLWRIKNEVGRLAGSYEKLTPRT